MDQHAGRPLSVVYEPIEALRADPRTARTHPKRQLDQIIASIDAFGLNNPLLVDEDGVLIAGYGGLQAAKAIGLREVPTIALPGLSEAQKRTLRIADNKIALGAGWDLELLSGELRELATADLDLSLTGFSVGEIDVLLGKGRSRRRDPPRRAEGSPDDAL